MLRLDPGTAVSQPRARSRCGKAAAEYNVARGLHRCFGQKTAVVTALADTRSAGGCRTDLPGRRGPVTRQVVPYDGVGRTVRNGLNFTSAAWVLRAPVGCSDRGPPRFTAQGRDIDWKKIFTTKARAGFSHRRESSVPWSRKHATRGQGSPAGRAR